MIDNEIYTEAAYLVKLYGPPTKEDVDVCVYVLGMSLACGISCS
jgi:hypothetical protein